MRKKGLVYDFRVKATKCCNILRLDLQLQPYGWNLRNLTGWNRMSFWPLCNVCLWLPFDSHAWRMRYRLYSNCDHFGTKTPGGATYIPLHVVITDQTLLFFTQNTDMPKDWKVTLTTDLLWKKDTHIADHSPSANKDTQITDLKSHNNLSGWTSTHLLHKRQLLVLVRD